MDMLRTVVLPAVLLLACLRLACICCGFTPPNDDIDAGRPED